MFWGVFKPFGPPRLKPAAAPALESPPSPPLPSPPPFRIPEFRGPRIIPYFQKAEKVGVDVTGEDPATVLVENTLLRRGVVHALVRPRLGFESIEVLEPW